jgi:hypothetical protein
MVVILAEGDHESDVCRSPLDATGLAVVTPSQSLEKNVPAAAA